ncbi:aspartate dehydrogenase [Acerihabitans sp. KWT182]|uniref:Aspartate dehydrogenase n=1 Tax=Acerihabitans sp. KWT182 TaxID=3157919 RepID=A0AAU7QBQ8_9GAMM
MRCALRVPRGWTACVTRGRKPPRSWKGSAAEQAIDLDNITEATVIFEGTATESSLRYPKNANVTAAVALSGIGFNDTHVQLIADPAVDKNIHEIHAKGSFGEMFVRLSNNSLPDNPKTSWLAALSIEEAILKQIETFIF